LLAAYGRNLKGEGKGLIQGGAVREVMAAYRVAGMSSPANRRIQLHAIRYRKLGGVGGTGHSGKGGDRRVGDCTLTGKIPAICETVKGRKLVIHITPPKKRCLGEWSSPSDRGTSTGLGIKASPLGANGKNWGHHRATLVSLTILFITKTGEKVRGRGQKNMGPMGVKVGGVKQKQKGGLKINVQKKVGH